MASMAVAVASGRVAETPHMDVQVGARVEIEHQGQQYLGTVQKLPCEDSQGRYAVQCDVDPEGTWTFTAVVNSAKPKEDGSSDISVEQAFSSVCFPDVKKLHEAAEPQRPALSLVAYAQAPVTAPKVHTLLETPAPLVVTPQQLSVPVDAQAPVQSGGGKLYTAELPLHCVTASQVAPPEVVVVQSAERGGSYVAPPAQQSIVAGTGVGNVVTAGGSYVPPALANVQIVVTRGADQGGSYVPPVEQRPISTVTTSQNVVANSSSYVPPAQTSVPGSHAQVTVMSGSAGSYVPPPARNPPPGQAREAPAVKVSSYVPPARVGSYVPPSRGASSYVHPPSRVCAPVQGAGSYVPPQAQFVSPLGTTPCVIVENNGVVAVPPTIQHTSTYRTGSYVPPQSSPLLPQALPAAHFATGQLQQAQHNFAQAAALSMPQFQQPTYAPPSLTAGLPDPASIASQEAAYMKTLDTQEAQTLAALQGQREQHLAAIAEHAEMQRRQILMQIAQQAKQLEAALLQDYSQQVTQTKHQYSEMRLTLNQQAISLSTEFQQKHVQEVAMKQQAQLEWERAASEQQFLAEVHRSQQPAANITQTQLYVAPMHPTAQAHVPLQALGQGGSYVAQSMAMTGRTGSYVPSPPPQYLAPAGSYVPPPSPCFAPAAIGAGSYVPPPSMDLTTVDAGWYMVPSGSSVGMPAIV